MDDDISQLSIPELITRRSYIEAHRADAANIAKNLKDRLDAIDARLLQIHEENPEVLQYGDGRHAIRFSEEVVYSPAPDKRADLLQWCKDNDFMHLLTWKLNNASVREHLALTEELPHVVPFVKKKVLMSKL